MKIVSRAWRERARVIAREISRQFTRYSAIKISLIYPEIMTDATLRVLLLSCRVIKHPANRGGCDARGKPDIGRVSRYPGDP
jgi:hypothetical protein